MIPRSKQRYIKNSTEQNKSQKISHKEKDNMKYSLGVQNISCSFIGGPAYKQFIYKAPLEMLHTEMLSV